jgi:hypothetical protein
MPRIGSVSPHRVFTFPDKKDPLLLHAKMKVHIFEGMNRKRKTPRCQKCVSFGNSKSRALLFNWGILCFVITIMFDLNCLNE